MNGAAVEPAGLRERKKRQTREAIADAAAQLFAERGYERVAVIDVARAAKVAEQTVYNYFPTKEHLVLDRDEALRDRLVQLVSERPPGTSPAAAIRQEALDFVEEIRELRREQIRGGLGSLATASPTIRRLSLDMTDRHATAIAAVLTETTPGLHPCVAKVQGIALAWVFQTITDETGRRARAGHDTHRIANDLRQIVAAMLDDLDRWLNPPPHRPTQRSRRRR